MRLFSFEWQSGQFLNFLISSFFNLFQQTLHFLYYLLSIFYPVTIHVPKLLPQELQLTYNSLITLVQFLAIHSNFYNFSST